MIGETLQHYKIVERLGRGGMGEVYLAEDSKLNRQVALKVLTAEVADNPEYRSRFKREAQSIAALNHPNIVTIHAVEESEGTLFLVMELIKGRPLTGAIPRGGLPLLELLDIAIPLVDAVSAAHRVGILHRDLKPDNVMIDEAGGVKVLDFGLAKRADEGAVEQQATVILADNQLTGEGRILGTVAYMSPEQAEGRPVDVRSDVFSLGTMLYEMSTGQRPFSGETPLSTLTSIMRDDPPPVFSLNATLPRELARITRRCLAKKPDRRYESATGLRNDLLDLREQLVSGELTTPSLPSRSRRGSPLLSRRTFAGAGAGILFGALLIALGPGLRGGAEPEPGRVTRLTMTLPPDAQPITDSGVAMAWTPDGRGIVYRGSRNGQTSIFRRDLNADAPILIPGTQGGNYPFFSPDGRWLAFGVHDEVVKVPVEGGTPISIRAGSVDWGAVWSPDGSIIAPLSLNGGLMRFSEAGGEAVALTEPGEGELGHWWPSLLPDGKHVLFTCWRSTVDDASIEVVPMEGGDPRELIPNAAFARYATSGHLIFSRGTSLMAVPFDPVRIEVRGSAVVVQDSVLVLNGDGAAMAAFGGDGTLVYYPASASSRWLAWVEPGPDPEHPVVRPVTEARKNYGEVSVAPDGRHLAVDIASGTEVDIWVLDTQRDTQTRITLDGTNENPVWTPDGRMLTFSSLRRGPYEIYQTAADGSGGERLLYGKPPEDVHPESWSPQGRLAVRRAGDTQSDIMVLDPHGKDGQPEVESYVATDVDERSPAFSPDGKWMLYQSRVSGRTEVYLQPYPPSGGRLQISVNGGSFPLWAPDGTAVFYRNATGLYRVPVALHSRPEIGNPSLLIDEAGLPGKLWYYAIHPDGKRFVMILQSRETRPLEVVQNWLQEVERLAGKGR